MKLRLTTDASDLFLRPGLENADTPLLTIRIHLDTGKKPPPRMDKLTISVSSHETLAFPSGRYEATTLFDWTQEIGEAAGLAIQPNTMYTWQAIFRVSNETDEYHRSQYARRYQKGTVKLTTPGLLRPKTMTLEKNLFFVHQPASDSTFSYSKSESIVADRLGLMLVKAASVHLNLGGYLRVWLDIPTPAPEVQIQQFEVSLLQSIVLRSRSDLKIEEVCPVERLPFLTVKGKEVDVGHWIARLPHDSAARPSSSSVLKRGIITTHSLEFALTYTLTDQPNSTKSKDDSSSRVYRVRWPIEVPSCALRYYSLRLPEYAQDDAAPVPERERDEFVSPNEHTSTEHCVCGQPLDVLLAIEGELVAARLQDEASRGNTPGEDVQPPIVMDEARLKFESGTRTPKTPS